MKKFILIAMIGFLTSITGFASSPEQMSDVINIEQYDYTVAIADVTFAEAGLQNPSIAIEIISLYDSPVFALSDNTEISVSKAEDIPAYLGDTPIIKSEVLTYRQHLYKQRYKNNYLTSRIATNVGKLFSAKNININTGKLIERKTEVCMLC